MSPVKVLVYQTDILSDIISKWAEDTPYLQFYGASGLEELLDLAQRIKPQIALADADHDYVLSCLAALDEPPICLNLFRNWSKEQKVRAITFGRFDLFYQGKCVQFSCRKSKELLALCIDRCGGDVTMEEAVNKLWPDRVYDNRVKRLYRKAASSLRKEFLKMNLPDAFVTLRGRCYIRTEYFQCDYFDWLNGVTGHFPPFSGKYLFDFSWAEETLAKLEQHYPDRNSDELG